MDIVPDCVPGIDGSPQTPLLQGLSAIERGRPQRVEALATIAEMKQVKVDKYGEFIVRAIMEFASARGHPGCAPRVACT